MVNLIRFQAVQLQVKACAKCVLKIHLQDETRWNQ